MKLSKKLAVVALSALMLFNIAFSVSADSPISAENVSLRWAVRLGKSYRTAPSEPIEAESRVIVMSGNRLLKLDKSTGEIIAEAQMSAPLGYSCVAPTYRNGVIFCPVDDGIIEAFDFDTLEKLWSYKDSLGGQALTKIVCDGERIYSGFWNDEDENASFVCLDAANGKKLWSVENKGGFYWSGCAVVGDYVIFGGDDGTIYDDRASKIFLVDKLSGEIKDTYGTLGDIRSTAVYCEENGRVYLTAKSGFIYSADISNGSFDDVKKTYLGGASTSTPTVVGGRVYVGVQGNNLKGSVCILDADTLGIIKNINAPGYPQNKLLVYAFGGINYVLFTYNNNPGGIAYFADSEDCEVRDLFVPEEGQRAFSISAIFPGEDGSLYYKNDSGYIFALENKLVGKNIISRLKTFIEKIMKMIDFLCGVFSSFA